MLLLSTLVWAQSPSEKLTKQAAQEFAKKDYKDALELYDKALVADKKNMVAYFGRAKTKVEIKDNPGALSDLNRVIKADTLNSEALVLRGNIYSSQKKYALALKDLNKAINIDPEQELGYIGRGQTYYYKNKMDSAIADYSKAIDINPKNTATYHKRSECYNKQGKNELAQQDMEKIVELNPKDIDAKSTLASYYIVHENFEKANALFDEIYKAKKNDPYVLNNYGYVKHKMGNSEKGIDMINQSLQIWPQNSYAYRNLALIFLSLEDKEQACVAIKKGLMLGFSKSYGPELDNLKKEHCK